MNVKWFCCCVFFSLQNKHRQNSQQQSDDVNLVKNFFYFSLSQKQLWPDFPFTHGQRCSYHRDFSFPNPHLQVFGGQTTNPPQNGETGSSSCGSNTAALVVVLQCLEGSDLRFGSSNDTICNCCSLFVVLIQNTCSY